MVRFLWENLLPLVARMAEMSFHSATSLFFRDRITIMTSTNLLSSQIKQKECPLDPGGYFIVRGQEKVILVQEQMSKNRVIVEQFKGIIQASVTSHSETTKTRTYIVLKRSGLFLKHNSLNEDIPVVIFLRAMGIQSDHEILLLVAGNDAQYQDEFAPSLELAAQEGVFTQEQALDYISTRIKVDLYPGRFGRDSNKWASKQNVLDKLAQQIIPHVHVQGMNFQPKVGSDDVFGAQPARSFLRASLYRKQIAESDSACYRNWCVIILTYLLTYHSSTGALCGFHDT